MNFGNDYLQNARNTKSLALLYLALTGVSLLLVHSSAYEPAVSFLPLYFVVAGVCVGMVAMLLLPAEQFTDGFTIGAYTVCAALVAMLVFFSGGSASELFVMFFPLVLVSGLRGSWAIGLAALVASLVGYSAAMAPDFLNGGAGPDTPQTILFRTAALALTGVFVLAAVRRSAGAGGGGEYALDEDGKVLLGRLADEISTHKGADTAVILVDPGRELDDLDILLERVNARVGEPVLLEEGSVFGLVLGDTDERAVEGAARRILTAADSLGARGTRAGAAVHPHDARSPEGLLDAAGRALEAAIEAETPSAVVLAAHESERHPLKPRATFGRTEGKRR